MTVKQKLHEVIFEAETPAGKFFDVSLIVVILASIIVVCLETVAELESAYGSIFRLLEWIFTILFTIEYILRLWIVRNKLAYALSFYGIIDLLSILPAYLSLVLVGSQSLIVIRTLRLLRVFRVFKMVQFMSQGKMIRNALIASKEKIFIFLFFVLNVVVVLGSLMYLIEGGVNNSFTSIPRSVYWAIVTLTTVGYGDISPVTAMGQFIAAIMMIMGYAVIAVPTGIVSSEMIRTQTKEKYSKASTLHCDSCGYADHDTNAKFCKICGNQIQFDE